MRSAGVALLRLCGLPSSKGRTEVGLVLVKAALGWVCRRCVVDIPP